MEIKGKEDLYPCITSYCEVHQTIKGLLLMLFGDACDLIYFCFTLYSCLEFLSFEGTLSQILLLVLQLLRVSESTLSNILIPRFILLHQKQSDPQLYLENVHSPLFCSAYLDCHLMVTNPMAYVEPFGKAGASGFTFHVEVSKGTTKCLNCSYFPLF